MNDETQRILGVEENKPTDWFERIYSASSVAGNGVPWANMAPHPVFKHWIDENALVGKGKTALVVGCGLGDDAIELEKRGFTVTAFDVSESAIALCKRRFPESKVEFLKANLLDGIQEWKKKFDFVLEIFTIQALPPKYEKKVMQHISDFVADHGELVVVTEIQKEKRNFEKGPPWLLNRDYVQSFEHYGLKKVFQSSSSTKAEIG